MKGYYCGTCHNGKMAHGDRKIFEACATKYAKEDLKRCNRCHSKGESVQHDYDFAAFTERLPKERFGNGIDWEKAEERGLITPLDYIEGVSIKRPALTVQKDFAIGRRSRRCRRSSSPIKSTPCGTAASCATRRSSPGSRRGRRNTRCPRSSRGNIAGRARHRGIPDHRLPEMPLEAGALIDVCFPERAGILPFRGRGGSGLGLPARPPTGGVRQPADRPDLHEEQAEAGHVLPLEPPAKIHVRGLPLRAGFRLQGKRQRDHRGGEPGGEICGACHDGKTAFGHDKPNCGKCHNGDRGYGKEKFAELASLRTVPRGTGSTGSGRWRRR